MDQWYEVDHIEIALLEPVSVAAGAMVWMVEDPSMAYGKIAVDPLDASKLIVEPDVLHNRQVAGYVGSFTFEIRPTASITDAADNALMMNTLKLEVLDVTAPEILSGVAKSVSDGNVDLVDGAFTVDQGYVVDTIDITMTELVVGDIGLVVTMVGYGP